MWALEGVTGCLRGIGVGAQDDCDENASGLDIGSGVVLLVGFFLGVRLRDDTWSFLIRGRCGSGSHQCPSLVRQRI